MKKEMDTLELMNAADQLIEMGIRTVHVEGGEALMAPGALDVLSRLTQREVTPELMRRNVVVSGINLAALGKGTFRLGEATLRGTGPCHPCGRIEENLGPGGLAAALGQAGITATVLEGGRVALGDRVGYVDETG